MTCFFAVSSSERTPCADREPDDRAEKHYPIKPFVAQGRHADLGMQTPRSSVCSGDHFTFVRPKASFTPGS